MKNSVKVCFIVMLLIMMPVKLFSQSLPVQEIDLRNVVNQVRFGHLKAGSTNPTGDQLNANSSYFELNSKPWFPVMGEFHYIRYPENQWEEEIVKMKSCGLSIIATYIFWNAHENPMGIWNWTGNLDLRHFIELCQKHGLYVWLRIGPFAHGEQLYGGFPEWIQKMEGKRTNDPEYLNEAQKLYQQIGIQTKGLFFKDGGPIIGTQLENEYAYGKSEHISSLKQIALEAGIIPAFFSLTGNTVFNEKDFIAIPLQGAYPYRGWEKAGGKATMDFLYANDQWIMTDALGKAYYDVNQYPKGLCEQGCGSQMTFTNRFIVEPHVVEAHLQNQIGRGMNLIGYYMFHGGTQMPGLKEPGCPESYDFQAPLGEFGFPRASYRYLKILHNFIRDYGQDLAKMVPVYPENPVTNQFNTDSLRYIVRILGNKGFVFLCNTQVRVNMPDKRFRLRLLLPEETLEFPKDTLFLKGQTTAILPFNLDIAGALLKYATVQPVSRINYKDNHYVFLTKIEGMNAELAFDCSTIKNISGDNWKQKTVNGRFIMTPADNNANKIDITAANGNKSTIIILTRDQAENCWRTNLDNQETIVLSESDLMCYEDGFEFRQLGNPAFEFDIFPPAYFKSRDKKLESEPNGIFKHYRINVPEVKIDEKISMVSRDRARISLPSALPVNFSDIILDIDYLGGSAEAHVNGNLVNDHLYYGPSWQIGLKRYLNPSVKEIEILVNPWSDLITGVPENLVQQNKRSKQKISNIKILPQYKVNILISNKTDKI
jgi:beta-galactosidase